MKRSRYKIARNFLLFWTLFIGIGALAGSSGMLLDPTGKAMGMDTMLPYFQVLNFLNISGMVSMHSSGRQQAASRLGTL